jgi:hypothetical protein
VGQRDQSVLSPQPIHPQAKDAKKDAKEYVVLSAFIREISGQFRVANSYYRGLRGLARMGKEKCTLPLRRPGCRRRAVLIRVNPRKSAVKMLDRGLRGLARMGKEKCVARGAVPQGRSYPRKSA